MVLDSSSHCRALSPGHGLFWSDDGGDTWEQRAGPGCPTAVFAHDDLLASGILKAAREKGLQVPDDLVVVGFNDTALAGPLGLTTVRQPFEESGEVAVQLLVEHIASPAATRRDVSLGVSLVERETS